MPTYLKNLLIVALILGSLGILFSMYKPEAVKPTKITTTDLITKINANEVKRIEVQDNTLSITSTTGEEFRVKKEGSVSANELFESYGISTETLSTIEMEVTEQGTATSLLKSIVPTLVFLVGFVIIFWFLMRQMSGVNNKAMQFGQSRAKEADGTKRVLFADVAGAVEAKEELQEVVDFLKNPKKYEDVGATIPKGVLLMGSPGTGKTLLARAIAGEARVPFFHMSGSEFMEMFVGVGASRVRDLFFKAKRLAPCIIFIDEIDAVGRKRGAGVGGGHDEREQTLNQILVEMDGFEANSGVIVIAATNRPDVLDPALLRPGRFDRRVTIDLPSLKDREAILAVHAKDKPLEKEVNLKRIAERTIGFSGADLMNIMNEGAILAARAGRKTILQIDLLSAIEKVMLGPERKTAVVHEDERLITAYHEAGHALVGHVLPHADEVHKISIISRGMAAGYTMSLPAEDKRMNFRREYIDRMAMMLGGYAAEKEIFGDITTGASNDLQKTTQTAKRLVTRFGMSDLLGPRTYGEQEEMIFLGREIHEQRDYSEETATKIDAEIYRLVTDALETARKIIREHRDRLDLVVKHLLEKEIIEKEEFEKIVGPALKAPKLEILGGSV